MDRTGADFLRTVRMVRERRGAHAVPVQLAVGSEDNFQGVIDLIRMTSPLSLDDLGTRSDETDIPADMRELAEEWRERLVEAVAEMTDELTHKYLQGDAPTGDENRRGGPGGAR